MSTGLNRVDSKESLETIIERNGVSNPSQALIRRVGLNWYLTTLPYIISEGFLWLRNSALERHRAQQVQADIHEITEHVSQVASNYIPHIKNAVNPADFSPLLNRTQVATIFPSQEGHQTETYETKLLEYRKTIKGGNLDSAKKDTAVRIFRGLGLGPADRILRPYLSNASEIPLSSLFKADRDAIRKVTREIGQGWASWGWSKLLGTVRLFDPMKDGNFPFLIGTRMIEGKPVNVLRHPIPTVEYGTIQIAPEYKAFLEHLKDQKTGVLYDCLLQLPGKVTLASSFIRTELLYKLGEEYPDVFHFVRMPFDGPLIKVDPFSTLEEYRDRIKGEIHRAINFPRDPSNEFIFGSTKISNVVDAYYEKIIDLAFNQISNVYPVSIEDSDDVTFIGSEKEKKQVFMMLVQTLLRSVLIRELNVMYYSNTCKHSSDRGAAATGCDLIWSHFLTNTLKDHLMDLRLTTACPAFVGKSSAVENSRAEPLDNFARFIERIESQGKREEVVDAYQKAGFPVEEAMSYYRPKIYYPQVGAEIHKSIQGQEAKREFYIEIEYNFNEPQSQLLNKLLGIFEDQYNLSFVRIGDEGVVVEMNDHEDTADCNLAKCRFLVNNMYGHTYGELNFTIKFPSSDQSSDVLHSTINSKLKAVFPPDE